jgi:hypothetical protein
LLLSSLQPSRCLKQRNNMLYLLKEASKIWTGYAGVRDNENVDKLAGQATIDGVVRLDREDILKRVISISLIDMGYLNCTQDMSIGAQTLPSTYKVHRLRMPVLCWLTRPLFLVYFSFLAVLIFTPNSLILTNEKGYW